MASDIDAAFQVLNDRLLELQLKFIEPHTDPTESPSDYALDVEGYIVLAHAALEDFVEKICYKVAEIATSEFKNNQKISFVALCMFHFTKQPLSLSSWNDNESLYDKMNEELHKILSEHKNTIVNNHGVNMKYLKNLLIPVGLDIPSDTKETNSLNTLAGWRGSFAHTSAISVTTCPSPNDATDVVSDVMLFMTKLYRQALGIKHFTYQ